MKKIVLLGLMVVAMASCSDNFIEEENLGNADAETTYKTASGFNLLVNSNYSLLRSIYGGDAYVFCAGTDLYAVGSGRGTEPEGLSRYSQLNPASDGGIEELYASCYEAIQKANMAIYYADLTEQTPNLPQLVGEVKYLRANAYFVLVQSFGGVSIVDEYIQGPKLSFDRNSAEEVYDFIIADLEDALNAVGTGNYNGRVNKRAVQHLLAKVHLTRAYETFGGATDFATAATYADEAIAGQALTIPFADLWKPGSEMNPETIFSVQYSPGSISFDPRNTGNKQANWYSSYLGGPEVAGKAPWRSYTLLPTQFALGLFTEEDQRYNATFMYQVFDRYYDFFDVPVANHGNLTVKHYYVPQWETPAETAAYVAAHPGVVTHAWGTYGAGVVSADFQTIPTKKFDDPKAAFVTGGGNSGGPSSRDIILSRLSETYLIAAEAYLNSNPALGLERLNAVRTRAGITTPLTSYNIDVLLDERARELFGEYHRWFDLKRTGKLVERASAHNYLIDEANFNGANGQLKILRPIPQAAIDLNQNRDFPQNPAYN
ncbi:RagB/SusD family nutrient uptake outer membrane protein [Flavobacterium sp. PLA-1-15]|uniref:RagB/SusD family nutrient uptake outer membrane protein n=1 Tax=Flavobacterium sp. PLA-1-15 TaxID=3380533 RepID=UPI003B7900E9